MRVAGKSLIAVAMVLVPTHARAQGALFKSGVDMALTVTVTDSAGQLSAAYGRSLRRLRGWRSADAVVVRQRAGASRCRVRKNPRHHAAELAGSST